MREFSFSPFGTLRKCHGHSRDIVVPEGVRALSKWCITGTHIHRVVLPKSLKTICSCAFSCSELDELIVQEGTEVIEDSAFTWGDRVMEIHRIVLPSTLREVRHNLYFRTCICYEVVFTKPENGPAQLNCRMDKSCFPPAWGTRVIWPYENVWPLNCAFPLVELEMQVELQADLIDPAGEGIAIQHALYNRYLRCLLDGEEYTGKNRDFLRKMGERIMAISLPAWSDRFRLNAEARMRLRALITDGAFSFEGLEHYLGASLRIGDNELTAAILERMRGRQDALSTEYQKTFGGGLD